MSRPDARDELVPYRDPDAVREGNTEVATWLVYLAGLVRRGELGAVSYGSLMLLRDGGAIALRVFQPGSEGLN